VICPFSTVYTKVLLAITSIPSTSPEAGGVRDDHLGPRRHEVVGIELNVLERREELVAEGLDPHVAPIHAPE
jgi:hypothetical protein